MLSFLYYIFIEDQSEFMIFQQGKWFINSKIILMNYVF